MSYDIELQDPVTGEMLELEGAHHMRGGTYVVDGVSRAELNVTYNYAAHYARVFDHEAGVRSLYGLTGAASIRRLDRAIAQLGDDVDPDYWKPTEGNAKRALLQLRALAEMRPDGVWAGD